MGKIVSKLKYWQPPSPTKTLFFAAALSVCTVVPFASSISILISRTDFSSIMTELSQDSVLASIVFTLSQALASTVLVIALAPALAIFLCFTPRPIYRTSLVLRTASFCFPSIVVASGLIMAWGNNGLITRALRGYAGDVSISLLLYSDYAVVIANVLMTAPFCSVILFKRLLDIPDQQLLSARLINLRFHQVLRVILLPAMRPTLLYYGGLSFLMSMGSFGALSILGTGPRSRTIELSIYQAVYYEGNWQLAGLLSVIHTLLCSFFTIIVLRSLSRSQRLNQPTPVGSDQRLTQLKKCLFDPRLGKLLATTVTVLVDVLVMTPIIAIFWQAYSTVAKSPNIEGISIIFSAMKETMRFTIPSAVLITVAAWFITRGYFRLRAMGSQKQAVALQLVALSGSIIPPMALAFGFLVLQSTLDISEARYVFLVLALTASILPFALSVCIPVYGARILPLNHSRLILGLSDITFFRRVEWLVMKNTLGLSFALALAVCLNETSIVTMLGDATKPALTTTMTRLMNQYRFGESALVACLLITITILTVFYVRQTEGLSND